MEPITWFINERGDLEIHLEGKVREELQQAIEWLDNPPEGSYWTEYGRLVVPVPEPGDDRNWVTEVGPWTDLLWDYFEPLVCNDEYEWIYPDEIGALTSAPILGIVDRDERGNEITKIHSLFWFPNYMLYGPQDELARTGKCIFKKAPEDN